MKRLILMPFLLCLIQLSNGQTSNIKIDKNYLLLGTLSDYMGREKYKEIDNRVDEYSKNKKALVFFLDSLFKDIYLDLRFFTNEKTGRFEIYSKTLAEKINEYYIYKPSGRAVYCGKSDFTTLNLDSLTKTKNFYATNFDSVYTGRLRTDIFKNDLQKLSFITGAYIRFGEATDSTFCIRMYNSVSKARICVNLLKEMKCSNVEYEILRNIPVNNIIHFTPTYELMNYFTTINQKINNDFSTK